MHVACGGEMEIRVAAKLRSRTLHRMADAGRNRDDPDRRCTNAQTEVHVDTRKHDVVADAVEHTAVPAPAIRQSRELAIHVVEKVRANVKHHADDIERERLVIVKVTCDDSADCRK